MQVALVASIAQAVDRWEEWCPIPEAVSACDATRANLIRPASIFDRRNGTTGLLDCRQMVFSLQAASGGRF
jgi:hypothetical protein